MAFLAHEVQDSVDWQKQCTELGVEEAAVAFTSCGRSADGHLWGHFGEKNVVVGT